MRRPATWRALLFGLLLSPAVAWASGDGELLGTLGALTLFLGAAKLGGHVALRLRQPAVLGELAAGVLLGNLRHLGLDVSTFALEDPTVALLGELGVILLLFEVGLESTVAQMAKVGVPATVVAVLGVVAPMVLGFVVGRWILPEHSWYMHLFLGAALCATSVGITARVLQDIGRSQSPEARVILGAAVIDDVLGLVVLASVSGLIAAADGGGSLGAGPILWILAKAVLFLGGALGVGTLLTPRLFRGAARLQGGGVLLGVSLAFCFGLAWLAQYMGLAPIVGAFAAGLVLETTHYRPFTERGEYELEHLVRPVVQFLAPVFFVLMGLRVDLAAFGDTTALGLAGALIVAAILGKQVCALGVPAGMDRLAVGLGMIPRGEVGLIFANQGLKLQVHGEPMIDGPTYTAIVLMVMVTTLVTPPLLTAAMRRRDAATGPGGDGGAPPPSREATHAAVPPGE